MERKKFIQTIFFLITSPTLFLTACDRQEKKKHEVQDTHTYTCPMHPQIIQDHPGSCPICGMTLALFDKNNQENYLTLSPEQQALAHIQVAAIGQGGTSDYKVLNGRLTIDPSATQYISSRNTGRIETLYSKETGISIKKGQALYRLYSEELLTLQQELLVTHKQAVQFKQDQRFQELYAAAKQKLLLYGQSAKQLETLIQANKTDPYITFYSPEQGIIAELLVNEGQYVSEGSNIMRLEGYGNLWVEADVYPNEATQLHEGQSLEVRLPGYETSLFTTIQFIAPALRDKAQTIIIRGSIPNPNQLLQAGMPVNVLLPQKANDNEIRLPSDAIIREAKGTHVWLALGKGRFEPKAVHIGKENLAETNVISGLKQGDHVVISGAYLLYSEYLLKKGKHPISN